MVRLLFIAVFLGAAAFAAPLPVPEAQPEPIYINVVPKLQAKLFRLGSKAATGVYTTVGTSAANVAVGHYKDRHGKISYEAAKSSNLKPGPIIVVRAETGTNMNGPEEKKHGHKAQAYPMPPTGDLAPEVVYGDKVPTKRDLQQAGNDFGTILALAMKGAAEAKGVDTTGFADDAHLGP